MAAVKAVARSPLVCPVRLEVKGWLALHQTSDDRLCPASPRVSTDCGNRIALATVAALGAKPCCLA